MFVDDSGLIVRLAQDARDLKAALERALATGGPAVIHVDVDPVKHMWAPGLMYFKDMHLEPKGK